MYAALAVYKFKLEKMEEAVNIWQDSLKAPQQQGFRGWC